MKIAIVVPGGVDRSGEYRVIPALLALLKRLALRHEVHVFALSQEPRPGSWTLLGAHIHNIGRRATYLRCLLEIVRSHRDRPFDVVQTLFSGACGFIGMTAACLLRVPGCVHVAGGELAALADIRYGGALTLAGKWRERWILRRAAAVTAASGPILDQIAALGVTARRLPLGVDVSQWPVKAPRRRAFGEPAHLIHVASLNPVKDQPTLLHALAELAKERIEFQLDIVGEDTLDGSMHTLARTMGLDRQVHFLRFKTQRELYPLMANAHVNLVSSRHEAGPLVVLEAAIAGVPTVGTSVGHLAEWDPSAAISVPVGDSKALAAAVARLLRDEPLRLRLSEEAQRRALFEDADQTAARFEAMYLQCRAGH